MKINRCLKLTYVALLGVLMLASCKKSENIEASTMHKSHINSDPIKNVVIAKNGLATITTQSGKKTERNVLLKPVEERAYFLRSGIPIDTSQQNSPVRETVVIPFNSNSLFKSGSFSLLEDSGEVFEYTVTRYSNGYSTVTVWPAVIYVSKDDYYVRATVLAVVTFGHRVTWDVNFVYTRNGVAFQTTQATYISY